MSFDVDEEILQDFLIEAGEILELLSEQLVALENDPNDSELLNAIFRGFHTVKGGAGFLSLSPMVDVCHEAENTFDLLRTGKRQVSADLMDIILQAVDAINAMFVQTKAGQQQEPADATLLANMKLLSSASPLPSTAAPVAAAPSEASIELFDCAPQPTSSIAGEGGIDEIDDDEFEALLDALHGSGSPSTTQPVAVSGLSQSQSDDITDDEFESLLDQLHGSGKFDKQASSASLIDIPPAVDATDISDDEFESLLDELHGAGKFDTQASSESLVDIPPAVDSDDISDDEFEKLLDELHGAGGKPGAGAVASAPAAKKSVAAVPAPTATPATTARVVKSAANPVAAEKKAVAKPAPANMPQAETTVRVDTARLDQIMNMVGELVLVRNRLLSLGVSRDDEEMSKALANLDLVTADLQGAVMKTRMQPIKKVFGRFPRVVRDLARTLNKDITLTMIGEDTDLDKNLVEALADPLVHLVRNSVDHGIEMPAEREASGKPRTGTITLSASQEGDHILLKIEDDGAGMDPNKLKEIAIARGVLDDDGAARMSDQEAYNLIFAPGFSTKVEISDISGRGVGMDVVKTRIAQLNGTIHIDSLKGKGTVLEIKVPLTLAIMPTLMVEVATQVFALPLSSVSEIFHLDLTKTNIVDGQLTVIVRQKAVPLFYLEHWLSRVPSSLKHGDKTHGHVVIVQLGTKQIGFVVDSLIGQEEVVIKPLGTMLHGTPGMAGATITSDGGIALILDVPGLLKHYARK